jgi:hypothetical protein
MFVNRTFGLSVILIGAIATQAAAEYKAVLSCGFNGQHMNIAACFWDTELKLTNNGQTGVYKVHNVNEIGLEYGDGLHIELSNSFSLTAQNSDDTLTLGIRIFDSAGNEVYQDMVGRFGVIKVGN